jgi:hypothetical protein
MAYAPIPGRVRKARLPHPVATALTAELRPFVEEVVADIAAEVPAYAESLLGGGYDVHAVAERTFARFLRAVDETTGDRDPLDQLHPAFVALGRAEWRAGRALTTLLTAYRAGARAAWRRIGQIGIRVGIGPQELVRMAETVFAYVDELSSASAQGYAEEQSASAAERDRRRTELAELLLRAGVEPGRLRAAAEAADWAPPQQLALALVPATSRYAPPQSGRTAAQAAWRIGPNALPVAHGELTGVIVPDPEGPGRTARLRRALAGRHAVVGQSCPWTELAASVPTTALALRLVGEATLPDEDPAFVDNHIAALLVHQEPPLLESLIRRRLGRLDALTERQRRRLLGTLAAWLDHQGDTTATARSLGVHRQTVSYRMDQLASTLGEDLSDPQLRFELALVLRARGIRG